VYNGLGVTPRVVHIDSLKGVVDLVSRDMVGGPCARGGLCVLDLGVTLLTFDFLDFS
jgi:hypothetical protein